MRSLIQAGRLWLVCHNPQRSTGPCPTTRHDSIFTSGDMFLYRGDTWYAYVELGESQLSIDIPESYR